MLPWWQCSLNHDDLDGLLGLVAMDVVEVHPWGATIDDIERPDVLVFDLDPGEGVDWNFVVETAFASASWPVRQIGRNLISRSVGVVLLYDRRMVAGRAMEMKLVLHNRNVQWLTTYEVFAMALDSDKLDELLDVLPDDMDEFLDLVGSKVPQPKSAAQVRSIVDKIKGRVREPTEKARPEWFE